MVKKKGGRLEPFDSRKMARAVSRSGVSYATSLQVARAIKNHKSLSEKKQVSSFTLRKLVVEELITLNQHAAAKSYRGYKKAGGKKDRYERSFRPKSRLNKGARTRTKLSVKNKDHTGGRPPRW